METTNNSRFSELDAIMAKITESNERFNKAVQESNEAVAELKATNQELRDYLDMDLGQLFQAADNIVPCDPEVAEELDALAAELGL